MEILSDLFTRKDLSKDTAYDYYYVLELHNRIKSACKVAQENISQVVADTLNKQDKQAILEVFVPGEKVLVLLPQSNNKLIFSLRGPFEVVKKQSHLVYQVNIDGQVSPLHVNLLRKYYDRQIVSETTSAMGVATTLPLTTEQHPAPIDSGLSSSDNSVVSTNAVEPFTIFSEFPLPANIDNWELVFTDDLNACNSSIVKETCEDCVLKTLPTDNEKSKVTINPPLDDGKVKQVHKILTKFSDTLTSLPGHTHTVQHKIRLTTDEPVRVKPYQLPFASQNFVKDEIKKLLDLGVVEPSVSPFCSPIVLVKKKDGSLRLCIDFRKLKSVTVLDATDIPLPEDLFAEL
ncbi:reverse transcriptase [Elysia marginata]|uniref:Reverse transcriptase n=1 Tax=Elysia marginata TaxID=1093978 RepID=A0AAV4HAR6_9GAST|nr:reverse transcriptase [Elysia marginata]